MAAGAGLRRIAHFAPGPAQPVYRHGAGLPGAALPGARVAVPPARGLPALVPWGATHPRRAR